MMYSAPGCFSENMLIRMADGTDKRIGDVKAGDEVLAYNCEWYKDNEELVPAKVTFSSSGLTRFAPKYDRYTFSNGTVIEIIDRDRLYNIEDNKMKWIDEWYIGEHGLTVDGEVVELVSHEVVNEDIVFHDFTSDYANYFVNGILSGKKAARYPFFPSRGKPNN